MHLCYLYADSEGEWNTSRWRCHLYSNAINYRHEKEPLRFPHTAAMFSMRSALDIHHPVVQSKVGLADVIVWQRNVIDQPMYDAMEYWRALGKVVVADLDDHYPNIPASNPAFPFWIGNVHKLDPDPVKRLEEGLRHADALLSPSHVILEDWKDVIPGYLWPNYPSLLDYEPLQHRRPGEPDRIIGYEFDAEKKPTLVVKERPDSAGNIYIGWGGSISHVDSFFYSGVLQGLARVLEERPNVYFKFCGHEHRLDWLFERLPKEKVVRQDGVDPHHWPLVVATFDIGIAPLDLRESESVVGEVQGRSYDERRSWLKLVEYLCAGVPFVATDSAPYEDLGRFGKVVPNTPEAWAEALFSRVDSLQHFHDEAEKNRAYALKRLTAEANADRLVNLMEKIGEETQTRRMGAKLPHTLYVN